tara:strand:+ start:131 stop:358 length:228 start_codon:yes stop_codon:yes gene_type:complete
MKKVIYFLLACGVFIFTACSSGNGNSDSTVETVVEEAVDSNVDEATHDHDHSDSTGHTHEHDHSDSTGHTHDHSE